MYYHLYYNLVQKLYFLTRDTLIICISHILGGKCVCFADQNAQMLVESNPARYIYVCLVCWQRKYQNC